MRVQTQKDQDAALRGFIERHGATLGALAARNAPRPSDGEDVVQESLLRLIRQGPPLERENEALAWVRVVIMRLAWRSGRHSQYDRRLRDSSQIARGRGEPVDFAEVVAGEAEDPLVRAIETEEAAEQILALRLCRAQERTVLALVGAGYGHREIALRTGLSARQIRKRSEHGRRKVRLYLAALKQGGDCAAALRKIAAGRRASPGHLRGCQACRCAATEARS